ncbi:phage tail tape measure protein [Corynebacterium glutamicum]|uniref:phage tail tape measure protein n=1 Tax=Corynebacterium glutamicum TaxID=1718 RepID=UPI003B5BF9F3
MATTYEMGFINVPISPTFVGIAGKLNDQLIKPARDAGKKAATEVEKSVEASVKSLERQVAASTKKLGDLDRAHQDSMSKRESQQGKLNAAIAEQSAAEEKYQQALKKGGSGLAELAKVEKAKAKVTDETLKLTKAERDITDAEQKHKKQLDDLQSTTEKYQKAQAGLNDEVGKSKDVFGGIRESMGGLKDQVSNMPGPLGSVGDVLSSFKAGPTAGVMAVAGAFTAAVGAVGKFNEDLTQSRVSMQNQFGLSADAARDMQGEIADALGTGMGSYEETALAVTQINQVLGDEIAHMGGQTAAQLSDDFMAFNATFARSAEETASTIDVMLNSGMVSNAQEGLDLLTAGMQKVPAAMQDEVFDAMNEYSKHFNTLGIDGADAMAMLVAASENGQYAIDKTGDAIKEFSLRGSDMSKTSTEAYDLIGLSAEDMASKIAAGGEGAQEALNRTAEGLLGIEDPAERANAAIALFGTPVEDLGVDQIPAFLEALTAGGDGMGDFAGAAQTMADNTQNTFSGMWNSFKGQVHGWAIDSMLTLNEWAGDAMSAIGDSRWWKGVESGWNVIKSLGSELLEYWAFIGEGIGNVFGIVATAYDETFGRVVESLYGFFEQGVGKISEFKDTVAEAWGELTGIFSGETQFNALSSLIGEDNAQTIIDIILDLGDRFTSFKDSVTEAFDDIWAAVEPVFSWIADFVKSQLMGTLESLWETVQSLADAWLEVAGALGGVLFDALSAAWEVLKSLWDLISPVLIPVLKILGAIIGGVVVGAFLALVGAIRVASEILEVLAGVISWVMSEIISPLISLIGDLISWIGDRLAGTISAFGDLWSNIWAGISSVWDGFTTLLGIGVDFIVATVFGGLGAGLDVLKSSFSTAVDAIGKIWDGLKQAAMAPVKFVVDTVWNGGLLRAINAVTGFIGMDPIEPIQIGFARGGILPGYSRMSDGDDQLVPMRQGEGVLVSEGLQDQASRELFLSANEQAKKGKSFAGFLSDYVAGYADGGIVGSMQSIMREFYPELSLTSHYRPGDSGYHGKNMAGDFSNTGSGMPSTPAMQAAAKFMFGNYGDQLEQLIHHPARNIGSGRDVGDGMSYYGAATMAGHTDHIHLAALRALVDPSGVVQMMPYDGESGGGFSIMGTIKRLWDGIVSKIMPYGDEGAGWFSQVPGNFRKSAGDMLWDFVTGKAGSGSYDGAGGISGDVESWREMAMDAMRRNGFDADNPAQVEAMLKQIQSESSGIPDRNQEIVDMNGTGASAGQGLLQIIPGTFADHRDPSLPNDRTDAWANMNAALRYYRSRYGDDLTTMWGQGHGYSEGGIVDLFTRDLGGWVPDGALVRNTSGRDELMLPPELSQAMTGFFNDYPEAASSLADAAVSIETASEWLAQAADYSSSEGAVARAVTRGILGIGIDLPGADLVSGFLDAEEAIWESRLKYSKHIDTIAEKEKALADALEALDELGSGDGELGTKDQRKIDDATAKVEEAKADLAKADSDEKRAKAADNLADAEEKLRRVREDSDESAEKDAKKHAEDITKANEAVAKAESELVEAKRQQASDLHAITILSADSLSGLQAQANGFAAQMIGMGAPAGLVAQGLGAVSGALGSVAGMAGPAGLTLGMALDIAKSVIQLVQMLEQMWKEIVEKITTYRTALLTGQADFLAGIAEINSLVSDQKMEIVSLANAWVDATLRMRDAIRGITEAAVGVLSANLEGAKAIADIQKKILGARGGSGGSGGSGSSGGSAFTDLHDMGLLYDSHADRLTATPRIKSSDGGSSGGGVSGIAASVDEIAALEWELLAAEKNYSIMLIDAMISMVDAQFEQIQATRDLERLEEDRDRAWARLLHMQEIQTQFAINEQQAIVQEQINELLRQNAEAESVLLDPMNRLADLLDVDGDGTFFGLFTNKGSLAVQAAQNTIDANNAQIEKLIAMQQPYGGTAEITPEMQATLEKAARLFAEGMDREAQWLLDSSALGDPGRALQLIDISDKLAAIDEKNLAIQREWEDLALKLDHIEATAGLEVLREGLQHDREYALASAEILRATSDEVREAAEALRDYHAQAAAQKPTVVTVHVPAAGTVVDADVLDQTLNQLGQQLDGVEIRTERLENAGKPTGGSVLVSKS